MRLIDADALMDVLGIADECKDCPQDKRGIYCEKSTDFRVACEAITDAPTIDAVEVVRCGECKWWLNDICSHWSDRRINRETKGDDFCSYGEKRRERC